MKIIKILFSIPLVSVLLVVFFLNVKIHYTPEAAIIGHDSINHDLLKQLRGLKEAANKNADIDMQRLYPEGYVFFNVLHGLAWCNFLQARDRESEYFKEGLEEINKAWKKIDSDYGRAGFDEQLPLSYGAYYVGWSTYLLGQKLSVEQSGADDQREAQYFKQRCDSIAASIKQIIYPQSYAASAWPADVVVCVASLALHDRIFSEKYSDTIKEWVVNVKSKLDSQGLIPHAAYAEGAAAENARGSSQSLMLLFLQDIDKAFADEQFLIYKSNFLEDKFGLYGIREYPQGQQGDGDVDSGPVIFDLGAAATIVGMNTLRLYGEHKIAANMRGAIEAFGFPTSSTDQKQYLFGELPMVDAFIAWGDSLNEITTNGTNHFTFFHLYSGIAATTMLLILWLFWRPKPSRK